MACGASGLERRVALEVLLPEHRGEATLERALIEEARLGGRLSHCNFVAVHDLGTPEVDPQSASPLGPLRPNP